MTAEQIVQTNIDKYDKKLKQETLNQIEKDETRNRLPFLNTKE